MNNALQLCGLLLVFPLAAGAQHSLPNVRITARSDAPVADQVVSVAVLSGAELERAAATHVSEVLFRIPATWISRGSGQEHLTAIRSPVLTGSGACGSFLFLEDDIPIRPSGFCNINNLFEINTEQAGAVEVIRGPGTAFHGSNALHGVINVRSKEPENDLATLRLDTGADDYYRMLGSIGQSRWRLDAQWVDSGSFRDGERFEQQKLNYKWDPVRAPYAQRLQFSSSVLRQQTAGFLIGEDAYRDPVLRSRNLNPEAFRNADSQRLSSRWQHTIDAQQDLQWVLVARKSQMQFLQHFLPGKPLEENGQRSLGLYSVWRHQGERSQFSLGLDFDYGNAFLKETQAQPLTTGPLFLQATRPVGKHYDYRVSLINSAVFARWQQALSERINLVAGLRYERQRFNYDNLMLDGNTRDDGSLCGFGGCLNSRPGDRVDTFDDIAPKFGLIWQWRAGLQTYLRFARGFRAPQANELYRLQNGQQIADLRSVALDSAELGLRAAQLGWVFELNGYSMKKRNVILRDADGFAISNGRTAHRGIEALITGSMGSDWRLDANLSYARQRYDFNRLAARGEVITAGNDIDTAPRWLASARLNWQPLSDTSLELEWLHMGRYFTDAANLHDYPGHDLFHLRGQVSLGNRWSLAARLLNVTDTRYAERADYAFGNERYFPGAERQFFVSLVFASVAGQPDQNGP